MAARPRMLQVCAVDFTVVTLLLPLIDACAGEYDVEIACAPGLESQRLQNMGYRFRSVPFSRGLNPVRHFRAFWSLVQLFRTERYDVVHTHTPIAAVIARAAARWCGMPIVVNTVHGFYFHEHMPTVYRRTAEAVERWAGRMTHFTFFQSSEDYESAVRLGICSKETGLVISNGIDQNRFNPDRPELKAGAAALRGEWGLGSEDLCFGIVARLVREKGVQELLDAFEVVQQRHPKAHLVLVGDALETDRDGMRTRIEQAISHPMYGSRIHWVGYRRDVETVLQALDVFVLPSYREGLPRSIIEAMSIGRPVIASNIRGCREEVVPGLTGLLVPPREVASLVSAMDKLAGDANLRARFGKAGRERAAELYNEKNVLDRELEQFRGLITQTTRFD